MDHQVVREAPDDRWEVEALYDLAFGPGREGLSSYRLREGRAPLADQCLVMRDTDGLLAGAVRSWPVTVGGAAAVLFGPIAVHPTRQGEGLGAILMYHSMEAARDAGWSRMMLVGDHGYYRRYGFSPLEDVKMPPPTNPARVLGHDLTPCAWDGVAGDVRPAD